MKTHAVQRVSRAVAIIACGVLLVVVQAVSAANQALIEAVNSVDECVSKLDKTALPKPVAQALKMDQAFVEKAISEAGCSVSDLVYIRVLAAKTGQKPPQILAKTEKGAWLGALKQAGVSEDEMAQIMDDAYAELAFKMMEFPRKKESKRTAKN